MNKGAAIIMALIAGIGGFALGNMVGGGSGSDSEASVEAHEITAEEAAAGAAAAGDVVRFNVPVTDAQPGKGADNALVTIVEFSEFQCPFCNRVGPTMAQILDEYEGKVRIVWRNQPLPFHDNAMPAAEAAMEAFAQGGDEKFFAMHDKLFANQRELGRENLERFAGEIGLDMTRFRAALDGHTHQAAIQADMAIATRLGSRGTPGFFINGRNLRGAQPFEAFKAIIDDEIQRAEQLIAAGTPRSQVYVALTANALTAPAAAPAKQAPQQARRRPDPNAVYKFALTGSNPQRGPDDALVTIIEVSDFECPFCSRVEPTVAQVVERYGDDVRVVWMNNPLPFHQNAGPAANAALEAFEQGGNAKFWAMHDLLFAHQRELGRPNLESYAQQIGLNMGQFRAALDNNEHQAAIQRQQQTAARFGARGTPAFFINGRFLSGAQPLQAFTNVVDAELVKARALVSAGTPRRGVYAASIASGATTAQFLDAAPAPAAAAPAAAAADTVYNLPVPAGAPTRGGNANAAVTIQVVSDYQCPFCSRVGPTYERILEEYGSRVRIVWRDFPLPFHNNAMIAAQAGREILRQGGDAKFWAYHDVLFANQRALDRPNLERYAQELGGINMAQFRAALDNETHKAVVEADVAAVRGSGAARIGTPASFINGRLVSGARPFEAFKTEIDRALAAN